MARPKVERRNLDLSVALMSDSQQRSLGALTAFRKQIRDARVIQGVQEDDDLFCTVVDLATREYGIRQAELARELKVSPPAVARWARQINLPATYARPSVIEKIGSMIDEHIEAQRKQKPALPRGRLSN